MRHWFLIEDDIDDQEIFCMALHTVDENITCSVANDGYAAIQKLKSDPTFIPDFIFLDVNMPKMNGIECLKALRQMETLRNTRIIMYSTSQEPKISSQSKALGADEFIVKPPSVDALVTIISTLINS